MSVLQGHCKRAVVAAATSARIMDWLLKDNNVSKRCWLIVFQAYTSCVILLHYVAQKQAHAFVGRQWEEELTEAAHCLHVLKFCGSLDVAAAEFHKQLASIYSQLEKWRTDPEATIGDTVNLPTAEQSLPNFHSSYLLTTPHSADSDRALLSAVLLEMLHGPFSKRPTYNMVGRQDA
ncbi:DASH complex subunit Duo1-domain-containing protein [Apiospora arundinis]